MITEQLGGGAKLGVVLVVHLWSTAFPDKAGHNVSVLKNLGNYAFCSVLHWITKLGK